MGIDLLYYINEIKKAHLFPAFLKQVLTHTQDVLYLLSLEFNSLHLSITYILFRAQGTGA